VVFLDFSLYRNTPLDPNTWIRGFTSSFTQSLVSCCIYFRCECGVPTTARFLFRYSVLLHSSTSTRTTPIQSMETAMPDSSMREKKRSGSSPAPSRALPRQTVRVLRTLINLFTGSDYEERIPLEPLQKKHLLHLCNCNATTYRPTLQDLYQSCWHGTLPSTATPPTPLERHECRYYDEYEREAAELRAKVISIPAPAVLNIITNAIKDRDSERTRSITDLAEHLSHYTKRMKKMAGCSSTPHRSHA
jgi:hypothetical protein